MPPPSNEQIVTHHSVSDMMILEFNTPSKNLLYSDVQENDVAEDFSTLITEFTRCYLQKPKHFMKILVSSGPDFSFLGDPIFLNCFKIGCSIPSSRPPPPSLLCTYVKITVLSTIKITGLIFMFMSHKGKSIKFKISHVT